MKGLIDKELDSKWLSHEPNDALRLRGSRVATWEKGAWRASEIKWAALYRAQWTTRGQTTTPKQFLTTSMDSSEETRELLLLLEIAEAEERKEKVSGKSRTGSTVTDEQLALQLHLEELERSHQILGDDHIAQSIANAIGTDADILALFRDIDKMEISDRAMAVNLSRSGAVDVPAATTPQRERPSTGLRPFAAFLNRQVSAASAPGSSRIGFISDECTICMDPIGKKTHLKAPCGHFYDEKCLVALVQKATKDESMFPPRCCKQAIPQDSFLSFLARDIRAEFTKSAAEFSSRPRDRVYCSNPVCSEFLTGSRSFIIRSIRCPQCTRYTCSACRQVAHPGDPVCKQEPGSGIQALVEEKQWQRCPECHSVIELTQGCYHITCRCTAQFCYVCAATWKECACPQWEERMLIVEARRRVDAEMREEVTVPIGRPTRAAAPVIERENRVERMKARLRENHNCTHDWNLSHGAGHCSNCSNYLNRYLLRCCDCYIKVCVACARNRM